MKKNLSLLTLLLCVCSGAWAEDVSVTWSMADGASSTGVANPATAATNITWSMGSNVVIDGTATGTYFDKTFTRFTNTTKLDNNRNKIDNNYVEFKFTPQGGSFTPTSVSFDITKIGTGDPKIWVYVIDGESNTLTLGEAVNIRKSSEDTPSESQSFTVSGATSSDKAVALRIYIGKLATNKQVGIANVVISGTMVSSDAPVFSSNVDALTLAANPISTSKSATFTLSGKNLTNGTYNLTVPTVDGLSVSPTSFTVADGACSQEFTVTYTSTADVAEAVANITATVDGIEAVVAVSYSSVANLYTQTAITGATIWDWSKYGVKEINTNGTAFYRTDVLIANVTFYGFDSPAAAFGPAQSLTLNGDYIVRDSKYCQVTSAKFTTTVPGMLKVVFSNTGGDRPYRYLYVNGKDTGVGSNSGTMVTASNIYVPAGDVELTAIIDPAADESYNPGTSSFIRISSIEFSTTLPETTTVTVNNGKGYRTFASKYPTDWSTVSGIEAYTASISGSDVTFTKVTGIVPAGEGLLLKATDGEYTIPVVASADAIENAFVGVTVEKKISDVGIFVLLDGEQGVGFYKTKDAFTVGANTAYLPALPTPETGEARTFIGFDFEDNTTTGITSMHNSQCIMHNEVYNLNGQRVMRSAEGRLQGKNAKKGLYIVNGKKVIK